MTAPRVIVENQSTTRQPRPRRPRKCGICGEVGHDRRNCPQRPNQPPPNQNTLPINGPAANTTGPSVVEGPVVCWNTCYYVVFDLETTGF